MLTEQEVELAFKLLLGRAPENQDILNYFRGLGDLERVRQEIFSSQEFLIKTFGCEDKRTVPWISFLHIDSVRRAARQMEHLASLGLPLEGRTVLEIGAGLGLQSTFFLDRGCRVTVTDGRPQNVDAINGLFKQLYGWYRANDRLEVAVLDIERPAPGAIAPHNVVFSYGVLYHCADPAQAIETMASYAKDLLIIETGASPLSGIRVRAMPEDSGNVTQGLHGLGCAPTREMIMSELKCSMGYGYMTLEQPQDEFYPADWTSLDVAERKVAGAVFVGSRKPLNLPTLSDTLVDVHGLMPVRELGSMA